MAMPPRNNHKEDSWLPESQTQPQPPPSPKRNPHFPFSSWSSSSSSAADNFSSDPRMKPIVFPPGFKFVPTDQDLIFHYLKPFLRDNKIPPPNVPIHLVNIYESNPERLSREYEKGNDKEWFFITERTKMQEGGKKQKRSDNEGSWKAVTAPKKIKAGQGVVGYKTGLDYRIGKNPNAVKSNWLMHEYWMESSSHGDSNGNKKMVDHALCKIYLTPSAHKRKAEEEENEKMKIKEEVVEALEEEVEQPRNVAFQQPYQPQSCPFISDELYELFNSYQIPDDFDAFWTGFIDQYPTLDGDIKSDNSCYLKKED